MSRHRMVRNLTEDDYDFDDDYYEDEDDYGDDYDSSYVAPKKKPTVSLTTQTSRAKPNKQQQQQQQHQQATKNPTANTTTSKAGTLPTPTSSSVSAVSGGISKPPPGWGKPSTVTSTHTTATTASLAVGITKPPPGWGKPGNDSTPSATKTSTASGVSVVGVSPPPGFGGRTLPSAPPPLPDASSPSPSATNNPLVSPSSSSSPLKTLPHATKPFEKPLPASWGKRQSSSSNNNNDNKNNKNYLPSQLSMVVLGHVDAGKSTLMGQLLIQTGQINKRQALRGVGTAGGGANLAWLLDENESERARGVTMEIGTKALATQNHRIVILDAPGHADFIPIMITGAANADTCILVVDAVTGEFESGFSGGGQTKEHILLAKGLGVSQVIVAVNKLDVEGWKEDRYQFVSQQVIEYLTRQNFKRPRIQCVPVSGLTGENVQAQTEPLLRQWYTGPTLLQAMNGFKPANRQLDKPLRFIISDVYAEGKGVVTRGRVAQGFVQIGDKVLVLPLGDLAFVSRLEHLVPPDDGTERLTVAIAGDTVELYLSNVDPSRVTVGNVVADTTHLPPITRTAKAKVLIMDQLTVPVIRGAQVLFHMHSLDIPGVITKLVSTLKPDGSIIKERPRALTSGMSAFVELKLDSKVVMEAFQDCRALGRFVLRRGGDTIAVGVIEETIQCNRERES